VLRQFSGCEINDLEKNADYCQVGLSYDTLTNMTHDLFEDKYYPIDGRNNIPSTGEDTPPYAFMNGTFGSGDPLSTSNTTDISARAAWHFLQSFLSAFPQYNPGVQPNSSNISTTGINLFAESYGGTYGPTFANYFEEQNQKRENGTIPKNSTLEIKLASLGIVNGLIDSLIQDYYYATFAYNNTYGIQTISQTDELNLIEQYNNDCSKQTNICRSIANASDPEGEGDNLQVNMACQTAVYDCNSLMSPFQNSNLSVYDIRVDNPSPDPPNAYLEYLNTESVQKAIGARVNYTTSSNAVFNAFIRTGDSIRGGQIQDIANLLRAGVRVSLMYGDADYIVSYFSPRDMISVHGTNMCDSATGKAERLLLSLSQLRSQTFLPTIQIGRTSLVGTERDTQILSSTRLMLEELCVNLATSRSAEFMTLDTRYHSINQKQHLLSLLASSMAPTLVLERRLIRETSHHRGL
jgi:hypothetical protein